MLGVELCAQDLWVSGRGISPPHTSRRQQRVCSAHWWEPELAHSTEYFLICSDNLSTRVLCDSSSNRTTLHTYTKKSYINSLVVFLSGKKKMFSRICTTSLHFQVAFLQVCLQPCSGFLHYLLKYFLAVSFPAPHIREVWLLRCMAVQRQARRDSSVVSLWTGHPS